MTHDRLARARQSVAEGATTARQVVRLGSYKVPVTVVALGLSVILHGGLLTAAYFAGRPARASNPKVSFARGDQATRIQVLLVPWPDPAEEEVTKQETQEDASSAESLALTISAEKLPDVADAAEAPLLEDVREVPPANDAVKETPRTQPVEAILGQLIRQLERFVMPPETNEQVDRRRPSVADEVEEAAAPSAEEAVQSNASPSQAAGVETGVEMLDLPTPKYPSLSRRRGEEGLVLLQVEVLPDGKVGGIMVLRDAGFVRLTEAAIAAVRKGRFRPATRDGHPIRDTVRIPFRFILR